jgi:hypothetical protein
MLIPRTFAGEPDLQWVDLFYCLSIRELSATLFVPLPLDWLLGRNSVSKLADLLTEWVFEGDLVSKMADLLTEKDIRCATTGLLRKH